MLLPQEILFIGYLLFHNQCLQINGELYLHGQVYLRILTHILNLLEERKLCLTTNGVETEKHILMSIVLMDMDQRQFQLQIPYQIEIITDILYLIIVDVLQ